MENHLEVITNGVMRVGGEVTPFGAGDAIAATVDIFGVQGIPLAPQVKARLGKGAKSLLEAGFNPQLVVAACVVAVRTGWFGSVETIAQEMVVAAAGASTTRRDFQEAISETTHKVETGQSRVWQLMREDAERRSAV
jgi:hypothetical protein